LSIELRNVVIPLDKEGRTLISGRQMVSLDHVQELLGEEILDLTAMRLEVWSFAGRAWIFRDLSGGTVYHVGETRMVSTAGLPAVCSKAALSRQATGGET
jgi:hypothetical protein